MSCKVEEISVQNLGAIENFTCNHLARINLIIGKNGTGKTFLLKALYTAIRSFEEYHRGEDIRPFADILSEKLRWTFQVERLGDMVTKSSKGPLAFKIRLGDDEIRCRFSPGAKSRVRTASAPNDGKKGNSIFIPAKEVFSLFSVILKSREVDNAFGFDDTYLDLAKALRISKSPAAFTDSIIDGKAEYDEQAGRWYYKNRKNQKFSIGAVSDGVKKIAMLDRLLSNGYLDDNSLIFLDEVESSLDPETLCRFLDLLENTGIQVFLTSHSYFVLKKLFLTALKEPGLVSCISLNKGQGVAVCDLHDGMPDTSILDTSVDLYEREIKQVLS